MGIHVQILSLTTSMLVYISLIVVSLSLCTFPIALFIGFELPSYTFEEPKNNLFPVPILDVALVTSIESERQFITEIALVQGTATQDTGSGGDYEFFNSRVIFDPGVTRQIVQFGLLSDYIAEGLENFMIRATRSEDGPTYDCVDPCISLTTINIVDNYRKHSGI